MSNHKTEEISGNRRKTDEITTDNFAQIFSFFTLKTPNLLICYERIISEFTLL